MENTKQISIEEKYSIETMKAKYARILANFYYEAGALFHSELTAEKAKSIIEHNIKFRIDNHGNDDEYIGITRDAEDFVEAHFESIKLSQIENTPSKVEREITSVESDTQYKGYKITPNLTGYVNYDFYPIDDEIITGSGESVEDCKKQIDFFVEEISVESSEKETLLSENNDIDTVGNCGNCGVEFHIHKPVMISTGLECSLHPDSLELLKVCFEELRLKMIRNQDKYGYSNEWLLNDWEEECRVNLLQHLQKGDPRDVAIYAMFMMYRGWSTVSPSPKEGIIFEGIDNICKNCSGTGLTSPKETVEQGEAETEIDFEIMSSNNNDSELIKDIKWMWENLSNEVGDSDRFNIPANVVSQVEALEQSQTNTSLTKESIKGEDVEEAEKKYDIEDMRAVAESYDKNWESFDKWLENYNAPI